MEYGLNIEYLNKLNLVFSSFDEIEEVILYGSRAKGNFKKGSDIDLTMKGENLNLYVLNKISATIDDLLIPYFVDLSIYKTIHNEDLLQHITRVGKTLYKKTNI